VPRLHTAHDPGMRSYTTIQTFQSSDQAVALRRLDGYAHSTAATAAAHPLTRDPEDVFSYETASVIHMLKEASTTHPDVNPLILTDAGAAPTGQQTAAKSSVSPIVSAGVLVTPPSWLLPVLVGGGTILLLAIPTMVLIIVFATRRARRKASIK